MDISGKSKDLDVTRLNQTLANFDPNEGRRRRQLYNFIYEEAISFEEPGKGIPFDKLLRVLAYKLVDAEQFLK